MGVNRVRVELTDGRTFDNVMVAGGRVMKVLGRNEIPFDASDVVAVTDFTDAPLPPRLLSRTSHAHNADSVRLRPSAHIAERAR